MHDLLVLVILTAIALALATNKFKEEQKEEPEPCAVLKPKGTVGTKTKDGKFRSNGNTRAVLEGLRLEDCK